MTGVTGVFGLDVTPVLAVDPVDPGVEEDFEDPLAKTRRIAGELIFFTRVYVVLGVVGVTGSRLPAEVLFTLVMMGVEGGGAKGGEGAL